MGEIVNIKPEPEWLDLELWNDYLENRKEIGSPMTETGKRRALKKLKRLIDDGGDQTLILERSIEGNWKGLFQQFKEEKRTQGNGQKRSDTEVMALGKRLKIEAKPGESIHEYSRRLLEAQRG